MKIAHIFCLCLSIGLVGCAERQTRSVGRSLQSYHAGVTEFKDFKRDAALVELPGQTDPVLPARSYTVPAGSPWKLYGRVYERGGYTWVTSRKWKFVVGDTNGAIATLSFESNGALIGITPPYVPGISPRPSFRETDH